MSVNNNTYLLFCVCVFNKCLQFVYDILQKQKKCLDVDIARPK